MTDQNISEKISDTITSIIIKKTNIFERLDNMKDLIKISTGFFIVTATITIINYYYIKQIESKSDEQVELIKHLNKQLLKNINDNSSSHFKLYQGLQSKIDRLLEIDFEIQNHS
jgi:predicted PurR-regulated permease PerM